MRHTTSHSPPLSLCVEQIIFSVHGNIVSGLTLTNTVSGATSGMTLDRVKYVAGSYPPSAVK